MISFKYLLGRKVDHFILEEFIGRGAMGMVFKASDTILARPVALKLISKSDEAPISSEAKKRLIREAQAAGRLSHPNIVTVHSYGETDEFQYISMEYVAGRNLAQIVAEKHKLELAESLSIMEQVLDAMAEAFRQGIVHRDIKPANILLTTNGRVKVTDFGLARLKSAASLTVTGTVMGTPYYMSPEQIAGKQVDIRSDIFSAGVVMYELLCGAKPFDGDTVSAVIYKIVNSEPAPISMHHIKIPDFVADIIEKAISKDVSFRYQTPEEMLADIVTARQLSSQLSTADGATIVRPSAVKATEASGGQIIPETDVLQTKTGSGARRLFLPVMLLAGGAVVLALFLYLKNSTVAPPVIGRGTQVASSSQSSTLPAQSVPVPHSTKSPLIPDSVTEEKKTEPPAPPPIEYSPSSNKSVPETRDGKESTPDGIVAKGGDIRDGKGAESTDSNDQSMKTPNTVERAKPQDNEQIAAQVMLAKAESAVHEGRISSPEGDNALVFYKQAFALDGKNDRIYSSIFSAAAESITQAKTAADKGDNSSARSLANQAQKILQIVPKPPQKQYQASLRKYEAEIGSILKTVSESRKQKPAQKHRTEVQHQEQTPPQQRVLKEDFPAGKRILKEDFPSGKRILKEGFPPAN